jgi:cytochrome b6
MPFFLWLDDRLALQEILEDVGPKFMLARVATFFLAVLGFGGLIHAAFLVQVATGFALTFYYRPSVSEALASVRSIMIDVHSGWLIRSGHRPPVSEALASVRSIMVCCIVLHVCRVYLTGGFKKPREVTWITGVALAVCIPVVGQVLVELIRGGPSVGQATLTRFYSLHTSVLPFVTLALMVYECLRGGLDFTNPLLERVSAAKNYGRAVYECLRGGLDFNNFTAVQSNLSWACQQRTTGGWFTSAYVAASTSRNPWITGVALAVCTVSFGVTGYSLPYDQVGYWALRIVSGVLTDGPFHFYLAGTRFYSLHPFVLPLVTLALMPVHFLLIRKP